MLYFIFHQKENIMRNDNRIITKIILANIIKNNAAAISSTKISPLISIRLASRQEHRFGLLLIARTHISQ